MIGKETMELGYGCYLHRHCDTFWLERVGPDGLPGDLSEQFDSFEALAEAYANNRIKYGFTNTRRS
jgi:hypothetical protein